MAITVNTKYLGDYFSASKLNEYGPSVKAAHDSLHNHTGAGNDFLGWLDLPVSYNKSEFQRIKAAAKRIREQSEILIVIGIGGSYLGARAAIEFLGSQFYNETADLKIYFVGNNISGDYLNSIVRLVKGKRFSINVVSKSGTTTEPAVAFRVLKELLESQFGDEASQRIYATTDKSRGTLKHLSDNNGYETFTIADDVGGRYSVLTAVGLLPIAAAGFDIDKLMSGAADAYKKYLSDDVTKNECYTYAASRNALYKAGKQIELMVSYEPCYSLMNEWYKQLYGESEGKDHKGLFPASVIYSTDLHSMGQYVQDGVRSLFETVVWFKKPKSDLFIEPVEDNFDELNFLAGQNMSIVNRSAFEGTLLAHTEGGVPNIIIELDSMTEYDLGWLIYFYEKACAVSGYLLGVNPFNQPGVESYKKNMFALLGKPGYEEMREALLDKLKD